MAGYKTHGKSGWYCASYGELVTDRYGLDTCTATWECSPEFFRDTSQVRYESENHPLFPWMTRVRKRLIAEPRRMVRLIVDYEGSELAEEAGQTEPEYELVAAVSEQMIETHPKFVERIGGRPSAPLNGAVFKDEQGNWYSAANPKGDDNARLSHFLLWHNDAKNRFAGLETYLDIGAVEWRKIWVANSMPNGELNQGGKVDNPSGPVPTVSSGYEWLHLGLNARKRGRVYECTVAWRLSGRGGYIPEVYDP